MALQAQQPRHFSNLPAELQVKIFEKYYEGPRLISVRANAEGALVYDIEPPFSMAPLLVSRSFYMLAKRPASNLPPTNTLNARPLAFKRLERWPQNQLIDKSVFSIELDDESRPLLADLKRKFENLEQVFCKEAVLLDDLIRSHNDPDAAAIRRTAADLSLNLSVVEILEGKFDDELCRLAYEGYMAQIGNQRSSEAAGAAEIRAFQDLSVKLPVTYALRTPMSGEHNIWTDVFGNQLSYYIALMVMEGGSSRIVSKKLRVVRYFPVEVLDVDYALSRIRREYEWRGLPLPGPQSETTA